MSAAAERGMATWIMRLYEGYGDLYIPRISGSQISKDQGIKEYELSLRSPPPTRKTLFSYMIITLCIWYVLLLLSMSCESSLSGGVKSHVHGIFKFMGVFKLSLTLVPARLLLTLNQTTLTTGIRILSLVSLTPSYI